MTRTEAIKIRTAQLNGRKVSADVALQAIEVINAKPAVTTGSQVSPERLRAINVAIDNMQVKLLKFELELRQVATGVAA